MQCSERVALLLKQELEGVMAFTTWTARVGTRQLCDYSAIVGLQGFDVVASALSCRTKRNQLLQQQQQLRAFASQARDYTDTSTTEGTKRSNHQIPSQIPPSFEEAAATSSAAAEHVPSPTNSSNVPSRSLAATANSSNMSGSGSPNSNSSCSSNNAGLISPVLLAQVSSTLNRLTGYESIDAIKGSVGSTDQQLQGVKRALQAAKADYEAQLAKQNQLHREVTALLQRKSSWVPTDVARFTELYAAEHQTEQAVAASKTRYSQLSDDAEQLQLKLVDLIRERYQQEQLWSDKIRRASTWWTWGLMGLHFASFVVVYTFLEPRKRAALQAAVADMLTQHLTTLDSRITQLAPGAAAAMQGAAVTAAAEAASTSEGGTSSIGGVKPPAPTQHQQLVPATVAVQDSQQELQHVVLQELQALRQQLDSLQTVLPAAAPATVGVPASNDQLQQQQTQARWRFPGGGWATAQLAAAGRSVQKLWQHSKQQTERLIEQFHTGRNQALEAQQARSSSSGASMGMPQQQQATPGSGDSRKQDAGSDQQVRQAQQQQAIQAAQQQQQPAAAAADESRQPAATATAAVAALPAGTGVQAGRPVSGFKPHNSLLQQLQSKEKVLEVTRGQLAAVTAGASVAGAALAAVLVAIFCGSAGAGSRG